MTGDIPRGSDGRPTHNAAGVIANACGPASAKTCCQRYTAVWTCADFAWTGPFAGAIGCVQTSLQLPAWTKTSDDGSTCTYSIDIGSTTSCTVDGDCTSLVTTPPALPTDTGCGCGVVCVCPDLSTVTISGLTGWCAAYNGTYTLNKYSFLGSCEWRFDSTKFVANYNAGLPPGPVLVSQGIRFRENLSGGYTVGLDYMGGGYAGERFAHGWSFDSAVCGPDTETATSGDLTDTADCGSGALTVTFS